MSLFDAINDKIAKDGIAKSKEYIDFYLTGNHYFDGRNSMYDVSSGGFSSGVAAASLNMFIGRSGSGKTTFVIQAACEIASKYENAAIYHLDFERSTQYQRVLALSGWTKEEFDKKYRILNSGISTESLYKLCRSIKDIKTSPEMRKKIEYDTGRKDRDGNPIMELPPTIVIVDSVATMYPEKINDEEEMSGQMSTTAAAKENNQLIKRLMGSSTLEAGNIIIMAINHITTKIEINPMAKTAAAINYLSPDESMPGGTSFPYLSNLLVKITARTKLDPNASSSSATKYGIKGYVSEFELIKSRFAPAGTKFEIIYSQAEGFLNELTDLKNILEMAPSLIKGSPRAYYFEELPDVKFTNKTFREVYKNNEDLRNLVTKIATKLYQDLVPKVREVDTAVDGSEAETKVLESGVTVQLIDAEQGIWKDVNSDDLYDDSGNEVEVVIE